MTNYLFGSGKMAAMNKGYFVTLVLLLGLAVGQAAEGMIQLLQKGLFEEEANHNLAEAIQAYQAVVSQAEEPRKIMATAIFRLGECYRKQGQTNLAALQYQRILSDFQDHTNLTRLSRRQLAALGVPDARNSLADQGSLLQPDEAKELRRVQVLIQTSPDLAGQELANAAKAGYLEIVRWLLKQGQMTPSQLNAALGQAVDSGHLAIAELLLTSGAEVNSHLPNRGTLLSVAVKRGFYNLVQLLLEHGANPNAQNTPYTGPGGAVYHGTPLFTAIFHSPKMTQMLLKYGANPNALDDRGYTAFARAVETGNEDLVRLLLEHKADVNPVFTAHTPLAIAVGYGQTNITRYLLDQGADPYLVKTNWGAFSALRSRIRDSELATTLGRMLLESAPSTNTPALEYELAHTLSWAVAGHNEPIVRRLLDLGVNVNAQPREPGWTPLAQAVSQQLEQLSSANQPASPPGSPAPGHAQRDGLSMMELLLKHGADPNIQNARNVTILGQLIYSIRPQGLD